VEQYGQAAEAVFEMVFLTSTKNLSDSDCLSLHDLIVKAKEASKMT
jgi:hypothetical protein